MNRFLTAGLALALLAIPASAQEVTAPLGSATFGAGPIDGSNNQPICIYDKPGGRCMPFLTRNGVSHSVSVLSGALSSLATVAMTGSAADLTGTLAAARLPALTGDVTSTGGTAATTIAGGAVTNAKLASGAALANIGAGNVTNTYLASGVAVANLGYTPVNKAGDTMTGPLIGTSTPGATAFSTIQTSDTTYTTFAGNALVSAVQGNMDAITGTLLNNSAPNTTVLPSAVIGAATVPVGSTGNLAFGIYGLGVLRASAGATVAGEFTSRNYCGAPDTNIPPNQGFSTPTCAPVAVNVTSGGSYPSSVGINMGVEAASTVGFNTDILLRGDYNQYGIFAVANPTGTQTTAFLQNNGNGLNLVLQTTGTAQSNNGVINITNSSSVVKWGIRQSGQMDWNGPNSTTVGAAGGASALPATPVGYEYIYVNGNQYRVPYYN